MNDTRVDHIEEARAGLGQKVDGLGVQLQVAATRLDSRIDRLTLEMRADFVKAFEQTPQGFNDHRACTEFVVERSANMFRAEMGARFDRLEKLITGQPTSARRPRRRT